MDISVIEERLNGFIRRMETEHERLKDEDIRQNHRLEVIEDTVRQIWSLTVSVEKLAVSMEGMLKEQAEQGKRLKTLEGRDGEMWRRVTGHIFTALAGIVLGYIFTQIGM